MPPHRYDIVCLSHLSWDFVFQRPQHLMTHAARERRVFYVEEPHLLPSDGPATPRLDVACRADNLWVIVPRLPSDLGPAASDAVRRRLLERFFHAHDIARYVLWYYTPMALGYARDWRPLATVYDCMDELANFKDAPRELAQREAALFRRADLVFTGGQSLYEAKRGRHPRVHAMPSSVDVAHFARARARRADPPDQAGIGRPRVGFCGVIDERMDLELLRDVAAARPDWQLVLVGPVAKIAPDALPRAANIHYLGPRPYAALPAYIAGWDVAILPFARNASTRYISPTKTPEYLAAGKPVVSTSIRDVVRPYGERGLARIADAPDDFVAAIEAALADDAAEHRRRADAFLAGMSWGSTWATMHALIERELARGPIEQPIKPAPAVAAALAD